MNIVVNTEIQQLSLGIVQSIIIPALRSLIYSPNVRTKSSRFKFSIYNILNKQFNSSEYVTGSGYFGGGTGISQGAVLADPGAPRMFF